MTNQQAFTKMVHHLRKQNSRSLMHPTEADNGLCAFRSPDGKQCAVGCLIPDELYHSEMETDSVAGVKGEVPDLQNVTTRMLCDMQHIHDTRPLENWELAFHDVARGYNMSVPQKEGS